jgi:cytoskeletal protein RodZ
MAHLGERLRKQRISQGVELSYISDQTRISMRYLQALENGEWNELPGSIFARSFARQYARLVGLDESAIESELQAAFQSEQPAMVEKAEGPPPRFQFSLAPLKDLVDSGLESRMPVYALSLAGVIAVCSVVYMGWQRFVMPVDVATSGTKARQELSAPPPTAAVPATVPAGEQAAVPASAAPQSGQLQVTTKDLGNGTAEMELAVPNSGASGMAVRIVASQETWVSIIANGQKLYSGILQPNDVKLLRGVERAQMVIGNAGGIQVSADGRPLGPIGNPGEVRVLELSPEGTQIKRAPPPPADGEQEPPARTD